MRGNGCEFDCCTSIFQLPTLSVCTQHVIFRNLFLNFLFRLGVSELFTCRKCNQQVMRSSRFLHSWMHLGVKPLKCSLCNHTFGFNLMARALKHLHTVHDGIEGEIIDQRAQYHQDHFIIRRQCFPSVNTRKRKGKK